MGECLITRRGGGIYKLPVLDASYPQDVTTSVIKDNTASATFGVVISEQGSPAEYTYQWYVNGTAVEGATSSSYVKDDLTETATYSVYCEVKNKKGVVTSRVATLNVTQHYTPVLNTDYPVDTTMLVGESFTCRVAVDTDGLPNNYTYQWYSNGVAIDGATSDTYTFTPTEVSITTLTCKVTNDAGTVTSRAATITTNAVYSLVPGAGINGSSSFYEVNGGRWYTTIDVSNYDTMKLKGRFEQFKGSVSVGLSPTEPSGATAPTVGYYHNFADGGKTFDDTYDISHLSGVMYFFVSGQYNHEETQYLSCTLSEVKFTNLAG